jgi:hypothetical protein
MKVNNPKYLFITFEYISSGYLRLGHNFTQRLYYIDFVDKTVARNEDCPEFLVNRKILIKSNGIIFRFIETLIKSFKYRNFITDRSIYSLIGLIHKIFRKVTWIVELQDCPYKSCSSLYVGNLKKWIPSYIKSKILFWAIRYSDRIIVSYMPERFNAYYRGDLSKVCFFKNAIPIKNQVFSKNDKKMNKEYRFISVGSDLPEFGIKEFIDHLKIYLSKRPHINIVFEIYGHKRNDAPCFENLTIINKSTLPRETIIERIQASDIGIVAHRKGSDIIFVYPIKAIEFFLYSKKAFFANTPGIRNLFECINSPDLYFFDADTYLDFDTVLSKVLLDLDNGIYDNDKQSKAELFSAEKKNKAIENIYLEALKI